MTSSTSHNRLIKGEGHVLVVEEANSPAVLHDMFLQMSSLIAGADEVVKELKESMLNLAGRQFVVIHYYDDFVSPSKFQGYGLVMLTFVPAKINEAIREVIKQAYDDELGRIFLIAARNDEDQHKLNVLKNEADRVVQARIGTLRNL
jgi:hypothetical protein